MLQMVGAPNVTSTKSGGARPPASAVPRTLPEADPAPATKRRMGDSAHRRPFTEAPLARRAMTLTSAPVCHQQPPATRSPPPPAAAHSPAATRSPAADDVAWPVCQLNSAPLQPMSRSTPPNQPAGTLGNGSPFSSTPSSAAFTRWRSPRSITSARCRSSAFRARSCSRSCASAMATRRMAWG